MISNITQRQRRSVGPFIAIAILIVVVIRTAWIAAGGEDRIVVNVPDDAFYYLVLAKHQATIGRWTFDGVAPATGFHLLWGYVLAFAYRVNSAWSLPQIFWIASLIGATCYAAAAWTLQRLLQPRLGLEASIAAIFVTFVGGRYLLLSTMVMEAPLVVLFATLALLTALGSDFCRDGFARAYFAPFLIGLFGELARSDFGLVPAALFVAAVFTARSNTILKDRRVRAALACLWGALVGLGLTVTHNYAVSGQLLQNSVMMKAHWSEIGGSIAYSPYLLIGDVFSLGGHLGNTVGLAIFIGLAVVSFVQVFRSKENLDLWVAATAITCAYALLYRNNSQAIQFWYLGSFILPCAIYLSITIRAISSTSLRLPVECGLVGATLINVYVSFKPIWPQAIYYAEAGRALATQRLTVGVWNAGMVGYFNYDRTVNLDGLANDHILPYAVEGRLLEYIRLRRLRYVADFSVMWEENYSRRGGYSDGKLARCLLPVQTIRVPSVPPWGKTYRVYRVNC